MFDVEDSYQANHIQARVVQCEILVYLRQTEGMKERHVNEMCIVGVHISS